MASSTSSKRFEIADIAAIVAGMTSIGVSLYGAPITAENAYTAPIGFIWAVFLGAGLMAIAAVWVAQQRRGPARALLAVAGALVLVAALYPGGEWVLLRIVHVVVGLVMLGAATSIGRMPVDARRTVDTKF